MALMFAICNPQPNWMPRKPKLMFQICQNVRGGLSISSSYRRFFYRSYSVTKLRSLALNSPLNAPGR